MNCGKEISIQDFQLQGVKVDLINNLELGVLYNLIYNLILNE